jgi:DNA-binding transcriptional ArsR family regulator
MKNDENVFSALADNNRRKIIELLHEKDTTLLELAKSFPISFQALSKHIKILESVNILQKEKQGKFRILSLNRDSLRPPLEWISYYSNFWNESFDKLDNLINRNNLDGDIK